MTDATRDLSAYHQLIARKKVAFQARGLTKWGEIPSSLFDHQRHGVEFSLRAGCGALFYDTGLGKTAMALAWGDQIVRASNKPVLMLAPLAVGPQHAREAAHAQMHHQDHERPLEVNWLCRPCHLAWHAFWRTTSRQTFARWLALQIKKQKSSANRKAA